MKKTTMNTVNGTKDADLMTDMLELLEQKLIKNIEEETTLIISVCSPEVKCLDSIHLYDYDIVENDVYLTGDDLELHIGIEEKTSMEYCNEVEEYFSIVTNGTEVNLYFA